MPKNMNRAISFFIGAFECFLPTGLAICLCAEMRHVSVLLAVETSRLDANALIGVKSSIRTKKTIFVNHVSAGLDIELGFVYLLSAEGKTC